MLYVLIFSFISLLTPHAYCITDNRSTAASLEIDCESADLKSARGQVTDETSLKSLISYKLVAGCQEVHSFSDSMYGLTFQGAVRALSICGR